MADVYVYAHDNRRGGWAIRDRRGSSVLEDQTSAVARMMEIPRLPVVRHLKSGGYWLVLFKPTDPPRSAGGEDTWEGKVHVVRLSDAEYRAAHHDPFRVLQDHLPPAALSPSFSGIADAREPRGELPRRRIRAEDPGYLRYAYAFFKKLPDDVRRQTYWSVTTPSEACGDHCVFTVSRDGEPFDEVRLANLHFDGRPLPNKPVVVPEPERAPKATPAPQPSLRDSALRRAPTTTSAGSAPDETIAAVFSRVQALEIKVRELADQQDRLTDALAALRGRLDDDAAVLGEGGDGDEAVKQATSATARAVRDLRKEVAELKKRSRSSVAPAAGGSSGRWPWLALGLGITAVAAVAWGMTRSGGAGDPGAEDDALIEDGAVVGDGTVTTGGTPARQPQGETSIDTGGAGVFIPPPADPPAARPSKGGRPPRPSTGGGGAQERGGGGAAGETRAEGQPAAEGTGTGTDGPGTSSDPFEEKL